MALQVRYRPICKPTLKGDKEKRKLTQCVENEHFCNCFLKGKQFLFLLPNMNTFKAADFNITAIVGVLLMCSN